MRCRRRVPTAGRTLVDRQERRASLQVCLRYECADISFVLSLISHFCMMAISSCLCSVLLPTFSLQLSPGFLLSISPCCLCYSSLPLPSAGLPPWLWPVVGLSVQCSPSVVLGWLGTLPLITPQQFLICLAVKLNRGGERTGALQWFILPL